MSDADYSARIKQFLQSTDWGKFYTDDAYKNVIQQNFENTFADEIAQDESVLKQSVNAYGHYNTFDRVHQLVMLLVGLSYKPDNSGNVTLQDDSGSLFGWMKDVADKLRSSESQSSHGSDYSQGKIWNVAGQGVWTLTAIESAVSNLMNSNLSDPTSVMSVSRGFINSVLEASALGKNVWRDISQNNLSPESPARAAPRYLSAALLSAFAVSGAVELARQSILAARASNTAEKVSAAFGVTSTMIGSVGGNLAKTYAQYCDATTLASSVPTTGAETTSPSVSAAEGAVADASLSASEGAVASGFKLSSATVGNIGTVLNAAAVVSGIISSAVLLGDPNLSSDQKLAIKEELGIQAASGAAALVLEGAMVAEAVTGPVGLLIGTAISIVSSLNPATWQAISQYADASNFYASQMHIEAGTSYHGNSALSAQYDLERVAAICQSIPIPFMNYIVGALEDRFVNSNRWDEYGRIAAQAPSVPGGVPGIFNQYYVNGLSDDTSELQPIEDRLNALTSQNTVTHAEVVQTVWAPPSAREYAAFAHVGYYMPTSGIEAIESWNNGPQALSTPAHVVHMEDPVTSVLRGMDFTTGQWLQGQDYTNSGIQNAFRMDISDGSAVLVSVGNPELSSDAISPVPGFPFVDFGSNHTSWNINGKTYYMVDNVVKVDFGDNPTIDFSRGSSAGASQYVAIGSPLSSPTNQLRFNHANRDINIKTDRGGTYHWDTDDSSWIYRDPAWSRAWNFNTGDFATTFDMGVEVTPTPYERSAVTMGAANDVLILGNRPVDADLGGGYNTVDYSKVGLGASSVGIKVSGNAGNLSVQRTITNGPVWVEGGHYEHFSWSNEESAWSPYLSVDNVAADYPTLNLTDSVKNAQAIRGSGGDDFISVVGTSIQTVIGSGGNDFIMSGDANSLHPVSLDYSGLDGSIVANFDQSGGVLTGRVSKAYQAPLYDNNGDPVTGSSGVVQFTQLSAQDKFFGSLSSIIGTKNGDAMTFGDEDSVIVGGGGDDNIEAGNGNNIAIVSNGNIYVGMGNGNNMVVIDGANVTGTIWCGSGNNSLAFSDSSETAAYQNGVNVDLSAGVAMEFAQVDGYPNPIPSVNVSVHNIDCVIGTNRNDVLIGNSSGSTLIGNGGSDILEAKGGSSVLVVNTTSVEPNNGSGVATMGSSKAYGSADGENLMISVTGTQDVSGVGDSGVYAGTARGTYMNDFFYGAGSRNTVDYSHHFSNASADQLGMTIDLSGQFVTDYARGSSTSDNNYQGLAGIRLADGFYVQSADTLIDIQSVVATNAADLVECGDQDCTINAMNGNDTIYCGAGNDNLILGTGSKTIVGEAAGTATAIYNFAKDDSDVNLLYGVQADLAAGIVKKGVDKDGTITQGTDSLSNVENVSASGVDADCYLLGDGKGNTLIGGLRNNYLNGKGGDEILIGGGGDNTLCAEQDNAQLFGGSGSNTFIVTTETASNTMVVSDNSQNLASIVGFDLSSGQALASKEVEIHNTPQALRNGAVDTLEINASLGDMCFARVQDDLVLQSWNTSTRIDVKDWYQSYGSELQNLKLDGAAAGAGNTVLFSQLDGFLSQLSASQGWTKLSATQVSSVLGGSVASGIAQPLVG